MRRFTLYAGGAPPYWASITKEYSRKKSNWEKGELRTNLFENLLEFLGFSFNPWNSKQNKASSVEIP